MQTSEEIGRRLLLAMDGQDENRLRGLLAVDVRMIRPGIDSHTGINDVLALLQAPYGVFTEVEHRVVAATVDLESVALELDVFATHSGHLSEFGEFHPTGEQVTWHSAVFLNIEEEKVARTSLHLDQITMYRQFGFQLATVGD